jgi:hypothetical protein
MASSASLPLIGTPALETALQKLAKEVGESRVIVADLSRTGEPERLAKEAGDVDVLRLIARRQHELRACLVQPSSDVRSKASRSASEQDGLAAKIFQRRKNKPEAA